MSKISQQELAEWNDNEKLAEAIERQLIVDALEAEPELVNAKRLRDQLDRMLNAWRGWSDLNGEIRKQLGYKTLLGVKYSQNGEVRLHDYEQKPEFTPEDLQRFDEKIHSLDTPERLAISHETLNKHDRYHRQKWLDTCREAGIKGLLLRDYPAELNKARDALIFYVLNEFG